MVTKEIKQTNIFKSAKRLLPGKLQEVASEIEKYKAGIAALQVIRWIGNGKINKKDLKCLYSGGHTQRHYGVAFLV